MSLIGFHEKGVGQEICIETILHERESWWQPSLTHWPGDFTSWRWSSGMTMNKEPINHAHLIPTTATTQKSTSQIASESTFWRSFISTCGFGNKER